jgi:hypothetical protein
MEYVAVIDFCQLICQGGLACGAVTVDCHNDLGLPCQLPINLLLYE